MLASVTGCIKVTTMERGAIFDLPNSISLSRLLLAFAFIVMDRPWQRVVLILAAATTDVLDGWIARRTRRLIS